MQQKLKSFLNGERKKIEWMVFIIQAHILKGLNTDQQTGNREYFTSDETIMSWNQNWILPWHISKLLLRELQSNIDPHAAGDTSSSCERTATAICGVISSRLLEALTAARIIFRGLIYSGPVFKPLLPRGKNAIFFPPFACDIVNSRA